MAKTSILTLTLSAILLTSCATMHAQNCTENAGYEKGMNDAKMGRMMSMGQFAVFCSGDDVTSTQKGYRAGYEAGQKNQGGAQLNLSFQNGKLGLVGAYSCQITYRNETFSDQASTETEARNNVLKKCRNKLPSCAESSISCSKN